jgi:acyl-CoA dehydrogenase
MSVLDVFRSTVGAAALGVCAPGAGRGAGQVARVQPIWRIQGRGAGRLQMVQGHLADMALEMDAAALLVYRAAWVKDQGAARPISARGGDGQAFATEASAAW